MLMCCLGCERNSLRLTVKTPTQYLPLLTAQVAIQLSVLKVGEMPPFLDHKIKCGNALIGATPELMEKGIPDAAFSVLPGDDPKTVAKYRLQNRKERQKREAIERAKGRRQLGLFEGSNKE